MTKETSNSNGKNNSANEDPITSNNDKIDSSFKVFNPCEYFLYCFIEEIDEPNIQQANEFYAELFGIKNAIDIQRFRYYPGTNNIYTFIGFIDPVQFGYSILNAEIKKHALNNQIYIYPIDKPEVQVKNIFKQGQDNISNLKNNCSCKNSSTSCDLVNCKIESSFKTFVPCKSLLYCFVDEMEKPNYLNAERFYTDLFRIRHASDFQRFRYYPGTNKIYTFIGFTDPIQMNYSINNSDIKKYAKNHHIYIFPFDDPEAKTKNNS